MRVCQSSTVGMRPSNLSKAFGWLARIEMDPLIRDAVS